MISKLENLVLTFGSILIWEHFGSSLLYFEILGSSLLGGKKDELIWDISGDKFCLSLINSYDIWDISAEHGLNLNPVDSVDRESQKSNLSPLSMFCLIWKRCFFLNLSCFLIAFWVPLIFKLYTNIQYIYIYKQKEHQEKTQGIQHVWTLFAPIFFGVLRLVFLYSILSCSGLVFFLDVFCVRGFLFAFVESSSL